MNNQIQKPLISVIIPVYNVEKYLCRCIDSVLLQTYRNLEVILVDDGSADNCPAICDEYARKDNRIKVIHKKNGGLSDARNSGIALARGDYVSFLDSDDFWYDSNVMEGVKECIISTCPDVVLLSWAKLFSNESVDKLSFIELDRNVICSDLFETKKRLLKKGIFKACAWDKVVKLELLKMKRIFFPVNLYSEDIPYCAKLISTLESIDIYSGKAYVYYQRQGSISKSVRKKNLEDVLHSITQEIEDLEKYSQKQKYIILSYLAYEYVVLLGLLRFAYSKDIYAKVHKLIFLLEYVENGKVNLVNKLYKLVGFYFLTYILNWFIKIKSNALFIKIRGLLS